MGFGLREGLRRQRCDKKMHTPAQSDDDHASAKAPAEKAAGGDPGRPAGQSGDPHKKQVGLKKNRPSNPSHAAPNCPTKTNATTKGERSESP